MRNSIVEQNFINWCSMLHPDINPYIFIHRHARYSEEYLPLLNKTMEEMHNYIHSKNPNVNFTLKGRIKSERSYLIKSYIKMCENIKKLFDNEQTVDERENMFKKYFKFLLTDNPEKYKELKGQTETITPAFDYVDSFLIIFNKLSKEEKDKFVYRLGRTEDTFAYRLIVDSVDFPVKAIHSSDSEFFIINQEGQKIPIYKAITLNPEKDIIHSDENDKNYIFINGKKEPLNERNLLYPDSLPSKQRIFENAQKDKNGNLTLLQDSFVFNNSSHLDIIDIKFNPQTNSTLITDSNGEVRNLSSLLAKGSLSLRKHDEESLIREVYNTSNTIQKFYIDNGIQSIWSRHKDYIAIPKEKTDYKSIHNSAVNKKHGYTIEEQDRTLEMEDSCKDETTRVGHDVYKKEKLEEYLENKILVKILSKDPDAFDSSTPTLVKILEAGDVELSEILGKYILTTLVNDIAESYQPPIDVVFEHTFKCKKSSSKDKEDKDDKQNVISSSINSESNSIPKLDFSSYENYIASKKTRNAILKKEASFPDIYEDY